MKRLIYPLIFIIVILLFFWKFFLHGLLPIPADTIVGMYHPWRDFYARKYPNGVPFKNFLITDPVRQLYPWRKLVIGLLKKGQWPLWNPYTFGGVPLLANFQSAVFFPLNILFFLPGVPFHTAWSFLVALQPVLAGLFLYLYLRHFKLRPEACFLGAISFAFSGFFIAWLEWNTILHSALWLPLILLSIEKIFSWFNASKKSKTKNQKLKTYIKNKKELLFWSFIFTFGLVSSFLAGHLQTFFYVFLTFLVYTCVRFLSLKSSQRAKIILLFAVSFLLFVIIASIQWLPALKFINLSARSADQIDWQKKEGWFVPWQHLVQFLAPDFFGNPSTLNYWGAWNYGEMVGYIGVLPFLMAIFAMIWRKDKKTLFFGSLFFLSLIFALPTPLAKLPFQLKIPFLSTSQPTRLLLLTDFSLAVLAALGFDYFLRQKTSIIQTIEVIVGLLVLYTALWSFVLAGNRWLANKRWLTNLAVAKRNLILPTGIFISTAILLLTSMLVRKKQLLNYKRFALFKASTIRGVKAHLGGEKCKTLLNFASAKVAPLAGRHCSIAQLLITIFLLTILCFDLLRFGWKFTPFTQVEYLFPETKTIKFLQKQKGPFRIMTTDRRILPPNFTIPYALQSVEGYDPLYPLRYAELITASERGKTDLSLPFGFNRIITPQNYESKIIDLLNVKYILSFDDLTSDRLVKVFEEGKTKVYENKKSFPRSFLVYDYKVVEDKERVIDFLINDKINFKKTALLEEDPDLDNETMKQCSNATIKKSKVEILRYTSNEVQLRTTTSCFALLLLSDNYYPGWKAEVDGKETRIYRADYVFRGVVVPAGKHKIDFYFSL